MIVLMSSMACHGRWPSRRLREAYGLRVYTGRARPGSQAKCTQMQMLSQARSPSAPARVCMQL
eukprot:scaffold819_cov105-Isochrysis_galbana.AAC.2